MAFQSSSILSLSLEFETIIAAGLQSWVNCVRLSGCLSLLVSISLCLPPWLLVSDSRISLVTVLVSGFPCKCLLLGPVVSGSPDVSLHLSPFIYFLLWLVVSRILASVVWLYGCLSLRLFLHVSPTMASGVRLSAFHLSRNSFVFNHQSGLVVVCLPSFVSHHVPHFICLPVHLPRAVSCSCLITISFVIGPDLCSLLPLCLLVVSGVTPE